MSNLPWFYSRSCKFLVFSCRGILFLKDIYVILSSDYSLIGKSYEEYPHGKGFAWSTYGKAGNGMKTPETSKNHGLLGKGEKRRIIPSFWSSISKALVSWWNILHRTTTCEHDLDPLCPTTIHLVGCSSNWNCLQIPSREKDSFGMDYLNQLYANSCN